MEIINNKKTLRQVNEKIKEDEYNKLPREEMFKLCYDNGKQIGVGLALPQIGINKTGFIINYKDIKEVIINPEIMNVDGCLVEMNESCLSLPGEVVNMNRFDFIYVKYTNLKGEIIQKELKGFEARIFQHEFDHLQGKLITDKKQPV